MSERLPVAGPFMLPREAYPFTLEFFRVDTREVVETIVVEAPVGTAICGIEIHGLAKELGVPVGVRMTTADGESTETEPK